MNGRAVEMLQARARAVKTQAAVRHWNYRQRHLAAGVWYRLRRALAQAQRAYIISEKVARDLIAEGYAPEPCGKDLVPEKTILFVEETRLAGVEQLRSIDVGLGADFLTARHVALVAFDDVGIRRRVEGKSAGQVMR